MFDFANYAAYNWGRYFAILHRDRHHTKSVNVVASNSSY